MARAIALSLTGASSLSAGSSSAQLSIGVTVVRSCVVDARPLNSSSPVRLACAPGAADALRMTQSAAHIVALDF